jgi:tetratricopeptide (TPR) repeat protein
MAERSAQVDSQPAASAAKRRLPGLGNLPYLLGIIGGLGLSSVSMTYLLREPEIPPEQEFQAALKFLDEHREQPARRLALALQDRGFQDRKFAGGVPFILGMCAFRDAIAYDDVGRDQRYLTAASYLREVQQQSIPDERRPEWAYAAGISLYRIGRPDEAQALLEEAVTTFPAGKHEVGLLLTQVYMDGRSKHNMEAALTLNTELVEDATLRTEDRDTAWLQRAQILLSLDRRGESEQALEKVSREGFRNHGSAILRAQTMMADGKYREALSTLDPLSRDVGLERVYPAQAMYLMGVCAEQLGELENAVAFFQRTSERFGQSHEATAARLGAAGALRKLGRNEESLEHYAQVLRSVSRPRSFRNRWISLKRLQETVVDAWNAWMENHFYEEAIALSEMMSPTLPREQSIELTARANQRWAQYLEAELGKGNADRQPARREELELHWRRSGLAYALLAENCRSTTDYYNALWTSAEDFIKGHEFTGAIANLNQFIDNRSSSLLPLALVRRGQCYMNLDRLDDALRDFQEAIASNPTDPVAFQARYLIGQCHLERNEPDKAETVWRKVLESKELTPSAMEWRNALCSLGKLLYDTADLARRRAGQVVLTGAEAAHDQQTVIMDRFDEAIQRLEEFRDRYPGLPETVELRFLLARALQKSAEFPEARWKTAETDNARAEFRRQMQERLERATHELQQLQITLQARLAAGQLDDAGRGMLRNCCFEAANCLYLLGRYEAAIAAYSSSAGRYQQEPDSLIAYVQIANCYDHLQKPAEALSTLAQAQLILKQLPDEAFSPTVSSKSRDDWQRWLTWAMKLHN